MKLLTDYQILKAVYNKHCQEYEEQEKTWGNRLYKHTPDNYKTPEEKDLQDMEFSIKLDLNYLSEKLKTNENTLYGLMFYNLNAKYGKEDRRVFFHWYSMEADPGSTEELPIYVRMPLLISALAELEDHRKKHQVNIGLVAAAFVTILWNIIDSSRLFRVATFLKGFFKCP